MARDLPGAQAERIGRAARAQAHEDASALDPDLAHEDPVSEENGRHRLSRATLVADRRELDERPAAATAAHEDDGSVRSQVPVEIPECGDVGETHGDLRRRARRRLRLERPVAQGGAARRDARGVRGVE
ncbi:MAG: hypothetical protein E6J38_14140 [Chloroflexi bacterium]|nr:MAG: hypothetical protein E6J38_14140 [Chloroflexota bacterium]